MNEGRIDFSSLDPSQNKEQWKAAITRIVHAAQTSQSTRTTLWVQLVAWAKPALVAAAAAACLCVSGAMTVAWSDAPAESAPRSEPMLTLADWATGQEQPSTDQIWQVFGRGNEQD